MGLLDKGNPIDLYAATPVFIRDFLNIMKKNYFSGVDVAMSGHKKGALDFQAPFIKNI